MSTQRSSALGAAVTKAARLVLLAPIWVYRRLISPMLPQRCRYYPSCSAYAEQAIREHGPLRGTWMGMRRLARCHPWAPGGVDHVPPADAQSTDLKRTEPAPSGAASPMTGV